MRPRTTVEDISQDMERINGQALDQLTERRDEIVGSTGADNGIDDDTHISLPVRKHGVVVQQFLNDVGEFLWQGFAHFGTGIFRGYILAYGNQLVQCCQIPAVYIAFLCFDQMKLLLRIINQGAEFFPFMVAQGISENFFDFSFDGSGSISQYVLEGFVLTVKVGKEMLGSFRQVDNRFQVDDFSTGSGYCREATR